MKVDVKEIPFAFKGHPLERVASEPGSRFVTEFQVQLDENRHKTLVESGQHDLYQEIQSHLEETLISTILDRAGMGDPTALNRVQSQYLDVTDLPNNLAEAQNLMIRMENEFNLLPKDVREKFDFSLDKYIADAGSDSWLEALGLVKVSDIPFATDVKESEVKSDDPE